MRSCRGRATRCVPPINEWAPRQGAAPSALRWHSLPQLAWRRNNLRSGRGMTGSTTSVLIVGAGPVGLALACELGLRGVAAMLIEKRDGTIAVPKQSMVSSRSMELCRRWGIAPAVRAAVWPQNHPRDFVYAESLRGRELLRVKLPSFAARERDDITPEPPCPCPQTYFDPILIERVKTFATIQIRYDARL